MLRLSAEEPRVLLAADFGNEDVELMQQHLTGDRRLQVLFALVAKLKNQNGGELFGDGTQPKLGVRRVRNSPFHIREPVAALCHDHAVVGDQGTSVEQP